MVVSNKRKQEARQPKGCLAYKSVLKASKTKTKASKGKFITPMSVRSVRESACSSIRGQFITHRPLPPVSSQAKPSQSSNIMSLIQQLCTCSVWLVHVTVSSLCARALASCLPVFAPHSYQQFPMSYKGIMLNTWAATLFSLPWLTDQCHRVILLVPDALMKWVHNIYAPPTHLMEGYKISTAAQQWLVFTKSAHTLQKVYNIGLKGILPQKLTGRPL